MYIYFDSTTGNVKRFVTKLKEQSPELIIRHVRELLTQEEVQPGHLITHTTGIGRVPKNTKRFMEIHHKSILSIATSGNKNWGVHFGECGEVLSREYNIPLIHKFELSGTKKDIIKLIQYYDGEQLD